MVFLVWLRAVSAQGIEKETLGDMSLPLAIAARSVPHSELCVYLCHVIVVGEQR
jgi:hypothetical protein